MKNLNEIAANYINGKISDFHNEVMQLTTVEAFALAITFQELYGFDLKAALYRIAQLGYKQSIEVNHLGASGD
jgi:hypothetical protein